MEKTEEKKGLYTVSGTVYYYSHMENRMEVLQKLNQNYHVIQTTSWFLVGRQRKLSDQKGNSWDGVRLAAQRQMTG